MAFLFAEVTLSVSKFTLWSLVLSTSAIIVCWIGFPWLLLLVARYSWRAFVCHQSPVAWTVAAGILCKFLASFSAVSTALTILKAFAKVKSASAKSLHWRHWSLHLQTRQSWSISSSVSQNSRYPDSPYSRAIYSLIVSPDFWIWVNKYKLNT